MKRILITIVMIASIVTLAACNSDVVVKTKAGNITKNDFYEELKNNYGEQVLETMIITKILENEYKITEEDIEFATASLKHEMGQQFQMWLLQNGIQSEDSDEFRELIHQFTLMDKLQFDGIDVTDEEIQEMYEDMIEDREIEIRASHILFKFDEDVDKDELLEQAEDILARLKNGEDFEELAKEYSDDSSAESGGDIGFFKKGAMVQEFEDTAYSLEVDEISEIIESEYGYHIIKLTDVKSLEESELIVRRKILEEKVDDEKVMKRYQQLLKDAEVDIRISEFEALKEVFNFEEPIIENPANDDANIDTNNEIDTNANKEE